MTGAQIHFRSYPDQLLVPCESEQAVRAHFFNSLKEAMCIAQGSADRVMQLSPSSQSQLWQVRCVLAPHHAPVPFGWFVVRVLRCWGHPTPWVTSGSSI